MYEKLKTALQTYAKRQGVHPDHGEQYPIDHVQIGDIAYEVVLYDYGSKDDKGRTFPTTGIKSPVCCYLRLPVSHNPAVNQGTHFKRIFDEGLQALSGYSIMSFLGQGMGGLQGHTIPPEQALVYYHQEHGDHEDKYRSGAQRKQAADNEDGPSQATKGLRNGVWHNLTTAIEVPIIDANYAGSAANDAPLIALGNSINRVLRSSPNATQFYDRYPPPHPTGNPDAQVVYVNQLRTYLRKLSISLIERDKWILLWRGHLYTSGTDFNFQQVYERSDYMKQFEQTGGYTDDAVIARIDAANSATMGYMTWGDLKQTQRFRSKYGQFKPKKDLEVEQVFEAIGHEILDYCSKIGCDAVDVFHESVYHELIAVLTESNPLHESLTYNQMLTATSNYWTTRLRNARNVVTQPPTLVMLKDGSTNLDFDFVSVPSTEHKRHKGYVKFIPESGKPNLLGKVKDWWKDVSQKFSRFRGSKVPPKVLKGSDLRKMLCDVSCDCKDFKYRMSWANGKHGVTSLPGRTDNGRAPLKTNPRGRPGFCKHILSTLRYLGDDTEIQISAELSKEQQAELEKDRNRFYKQADESYKKMQAPEAQPEPEEKPPEEEPEADQEQPQDNAPKRPSLPTRPDLPAKPAPTPNYGASQ